MGAVTVLDHFPCFQLSGGRYLSMEAHYYCGTHRLSLNFPHWISQSKVYGSKYTSRYMKSRKVLRMRQPSHSTNITEKKQNSTRIYLPNPFNFLFRPLLSLPSPVLLFFFLSFQSYLGFKFACMWL